jgi:glutathione peroxidase
MNKLLFSIFCIFFGQSALACSDLLDSEMRILDSAESQNLCDYDGKTLLVVNVASRCGYTYQYASLQSLYEKYKEEDFVVLGVPSRDFFSGIL